MMFPPWLSVDFSNTDERTMFQDVTKEKNCLTEGIYLFEVQIRN
jgi:hypothetical protein